MNRDELIQKMTGTLTSEEAIEIGKGAFMHVGMAEFAMLQLGQKRLCSSFLYFHECVEFLLGRSVLYHEFAEPDRLRAEAMNLKPSPSLQEIIDMLPKDKTIVVEGND